MCKKMITLLSLVIIALAGFGQSKIWGNIRVRKAFETKSEDDDKAANLSFTFPKDKSNYFLINAGIGYDFASSNKVLKRGKVFRNSFDGFFVYNRNNQIDKEQKNYKVGLSSNQIFFTNTETSTAIFGTNTLEYLRDYYDSAHSIVLTSYWHPFSKKQNSIKLGGYAQADNLFAYYFLPELGLEYQNKIEDKQKADKGYDFRGCFSVGGNLLLKKKTFDDDKNLLPRNRWTKGVELVVRYEARTSIIKNIDNTDSYIPMFKSELNFYPRYPESYAGLSRCSIKAGL